MADKVTKCSDVIKDLVFSGAKV